MKIILSGLIFLTVVYSHLANGVKNGRRRRYLMQHPAYSMMMNTPMIYSNGGMMGSGRGMGECITEDIVCPAYCLMEDEWGCKYCPCGPANGMSPPRVSGERPTEMRHEDHECLGTILCMLSCKDGYQLGEKKSNGCQSCTCKKKSVADNETQSTTPVTQSTASTSTSTTTTTVVPTTTTPSCTQTEACRQSCEFIVKLGPTGPDGCPLCECIRPLTKEPSKALLVLVPTTPPRRILYVQATPPPPCSEVEKCKSNCRYGFEVQNSHMEGECPTCRCIYPMTPSPPPHRTTPKANFISVIRLCPDAVHCMKSCIHGYTLTSSHSNDDDCPVCTCNEEPKLVLLCEQPLSCQKGCSVGFRCDDVGCPTCSCVLPSETVLHGEVLTTITEAALSCNPRFSCVNRCSFGYKTSDNGCPSCVCLSPVTVLHQMMVQSVTQVPLPPMIPPSGVGCQETSCSDIQVSGNGNPFFERVPNSQHFMGNAGTSTNGLNTQVILTNSNHAEPQSHMGQSSAGAHLVPILEVDTGLHNQPETECLAPSCLVPVGNILVAKTTPSPGQCLPILHCVTTCKDGYDIAENGEDGCPTCQCVER